MQRVSVSPRPNLERTALDHGFELDEAGGVRNWDESVYYRFTLRQVEDDIERCGEDIEAMCHEFLNRAVADDAIFRRLSIPESYWNYIAESWRGRQKDLYGRMEFLTTASGTPGCLNTIVPPIYSIYGRNLGILHHHRIPFPACIRSSKSSRTARRSTQKSLPCDSRCQWRSKKGPPRRCKKGPLGGCGLVPVVHGRAPRTTRRALNRLTRRRAREGPVGPRGQAWAGWSVQLAVGV